MNEDEITIKDEVKADAIMDAEWEAQVGTSEYAQYKRLVKQNFKKNVLLSRKGIQMTDISLLFTRMELLVDFAFPKGSKDRLELELLWQGRMKEAMEQAHNEFLQQQRIQDLSVAAKPKLFVPGQ